MGSGAEGGPGEILYPPRDDAVPWTLHQHAKPVPSADSRGPRPRNPAILLSLTLPSHSDTYILHTHTHTHTHTHITHTNISFLFLPPKSRNHKDIRWSDNIIYTPDVPTSQLLSGQDMESQRKKGAICTGKSRRASQRKRHLDCGV